MLFSAIKYGALSGKTRAMFGKLLKAHDYQEMMQKKNENEIVSYLKYNTHFSSVLSEIEEDKIHRGHLENILRREYINDYAKLMRFSNGGQREFINLLYLKIEIESLKLLLRVFESGDIDQGVLEESLLFLTRYDELNLPKLALSRNLEELLLGLKGTDYYEVMHHFISMDSNTRLFNLEMALDLYYFRKIQDELTGVLHGEDKDIAKEFSGIETDVFNIFWIYRSKTYYQTDKELIYTYVVPSYYRINRGIIDNLVEAKSFEEFYSVLQDTQYGYLFEGKGPGVFERNYNEFLYELHRKRFIKDTFSIACIISYLKLKEFELNNIISIIEGLHYKLLSEDLRKFIVGAGFNS